MLLLSGRAIGRSMRSSILCLIVPIDSLVLILTVLGNEPCCCPREGFRRPPSVPRECRFVFMAYHIGNASIMSSVLTAMIEQISSRVHSHFLQQRIQHIDFKLNCESLVLVVDFAIVLRKYP